MANTESIVTLRVGEVPAILKDWRNNACDGHFSGQSTTQKVLRTGYFWPMMFVDGKSHTKRCGVCQRYAQNDFHLDLPLNLSLPFMPFEKWGINYIRPIHPTSSGECNTSLWRSNT
jgi:hypothetical protein